MTTATPDADGARRRLEIYLRDHAGGAEAGVAVIQRCRKANVGTEFEPALADLEREIAEDRETLRSIMDRLGIEPSQMKVLVGRVAELVGRLKSNGGLVRYSPSSRVVELEGMAAGVVTKRNLWRALLRADVPGVSKEELDRLVERATGQLEQLLQLHDRATAEAFGAAGT
jgi:hypothetical protein